MASEIGVTRSEAKTAWGYRHVILVVIWLLYLINYFDRISVLTFLPYIQKDLNLTAVQVGWLGSVFFFGYALAQFSAGFLTDRWGPKKTMNIAIWVFTIVTCLTGFVRNLTQFIILRLGLALGEGHHYVPSTRMIANWFPREEKNRANGFFVTTWAVAPAIIPVIITWVAADFFGGAWRPIFLLLAVPGIIGILILWYYVTNTPKEMLDKGRMKQEEYNQITSSVGADVTVHGKSYSSKIFTHDIQFYVYNLAWFIMLMLYWGLTTWLAFFLVKQHGLNIKTMGVFASVPYVAAFIGMYGGGWVADKFLGKHPKIVSMIGFGGCVPVLYFLGQVPKGEINMLILALALAGFFVNLPWPTMQAYAQLRYPKEVIGRVMGITNGIGQMGAFISPLIAGYLVVTLADGSANFANVFIFWALSSIVATICVGFLKETEIDHSAFEN
ncbi:Sugar phosphate permease [Syntrophobacter sp. SbD2]|nr:Sugar phosphate permease [Syntrophobacter sp. SbD2]